MLLRTTRALLEQRVPLTKIGRVLRSLRRQIGDRPLTRLSVFKDGARVVAWDGSSRWQPESGQLLFNFDADRVVRRHASVAKLPEAQKTLLPVLTSEQWCDLAMDIEDSSPLEARAAYHHALDLDPANVVARINLGRLLHGDGNGFAGAVPYVERRARELVEAERREGATRAASATARAAGGHRKRARSRSSRPALRSSNRV